MHTTNIAIVDSGIDMKNKDISLNVIGGKSIILADDIQDENGHGTYCADVIRQVNPDVGFYIVKILDNQAKSSHRILNEALKHLINVNVKIINLSVSTINSENIDEMYSVCKELTDQGKIIVCSLDNKNKESYPAVFDNVLGVQGARSLNSEEYWFNSTYKIQCACSAMPVIVSGIKSKFDIFSGNSKATALFTGYLSKILCQNSFTFKHISNYLEANSKRTDWNDVMAYNGFRVNVGYDAKTENKNDIYIRERVLKTLCNTLDTGRKDIPKENVYSLLDLGLNIKNCCAFLENLEGEFSIKFNTPIKYSSLFTINSIIEVIRENTHD